MDEIQYSENMVDNCMAVLDLIDCYVENPNDKSLLRDAEDSIKKLDGRCFVTEGLFRNLVEGVGEG